MFKIPTLKDVAQMASVDPSTASRVLNDQPNARVRPETKARILRAAEELAYRPNAMARSLKVKKNLALGLFIPDVGNPVFPEIIKGVEQAAIKSGYSVFLSHLDEQWIKHKTYLNVFQEHRVDGLILATARTDNSVIDDLVRLDVPFVLINRRSSRTKNYVIVDDFAGAKMAVDHLIDLGHRDIAHISGPLMVDTSLRRLQGYRQSLADHGIAYNSALVEEGGWLSWNDGKIAMRKLLDREQRPSAVFASSLMVAVGAMAALRESGLRIPEDVSIIGLHDAPLAEVLDPPLTVIEMPLYGMGFKATKALIKVIDNKDYEGFGVLAPKGLVLRSSTGRP